MRQIARLVEELPELVEANPAGAGAIVRQARLWSAASVPECAEVSGYSASWWRLRERGGRAVSADDALVMQATLQRLDDRRWMMRTKLGRAWMAGPTAFGAVFRRMRLELGITPDEMAELLGVGRSYCRRVNAGAHPTIETLRQIVAALYGGPEHEHAVDG